LADIPDPVQSVLADPNRFAEASRGCFACGVENPSGLHLQVTYDPQAHAAETRVTLTAERQGWTGVAHGGIVSTLLDEMLSWSLGQEVPFFTVELTVRYRRAVPIGVELTARGRRTRLRGRYMEAEGEILGPDGTVLAQATGKFLAPPGYEPTKRRAAQQG